MTLQSNQLQKLLLVLLIFPPPLLSAEQLFDTHLHYNATDAAKYTPQRIIEILDRNNITQAVVTGTPPSHTARLHRHAPKRIVPFLSVYHSADDKITWVNDNTIPDKAKAQLKTGAWQGIGELHIFANDRHSTVFRSMIKLAEQNKLPLLIHSDPAVIDTLYDIAPTQPVIWAHAGKYPYPNLIADYLERYPHLMIDLTVRDERIAPNGKISDDWYHLFVQHSKRFLVGVDTYSSQRWDNFDTAVAIIRNWLSQLPTEVAKHLAYENAIKFFSKINEGNQNHSEVAG